MPFPALCQATCGGHKCSLSQERRCLVSTCHPHPDGAVLPWALPAPWGEEELYQEHQPPSLGCTAQTLQLFCTPKTLFSQLANGVIRPPLGLPQRGNEAAHMNTL